MGRRKKLPVTVFACQTLTRWSGLHKCRLGKAYRTVPSLKQRIRGLKAPLRRRVLKQAGENRKFSGHNAFVSAKVEELKQRGARVFVKAWRRALRAMHAEWRDMLAASKKEWAAVAECLVTQKRAARAAMRKVHTEPLKYNEPHPLSPWGLGSASRPCSEKQMKDIAKQLIPEGRKWLRAAYAKSLEITDRSSSGCCVVPDDRRFGLTLAAKVRARNLRCFEKTPGLCSKSPGFARFKALRNK